MDSTVLGSSSKSGSGSVVDGEAIFVGESTKT